MKGFLRSKRFLALATSIILLTAYAFPLANHSFAATGHSSHNIAYVNYDDSGFTESSIPSANIFTNSVVGGPAPTSSPSASVTYNGMTFTPLTRAALSSTSLAPFDTLILFAICDIATSLTASQHTAINNYLAAGNKILLYDADRCAPGSGLGGNADYSWFTFPFATSNPGPKGASGTLTVVENYTLTTSPNILANDPFSSDELGDANTATTSDPHWFAAAKTTNVLGNNGFFLAYARNKGLIIYDGADRWFTSAATKSLTDLFINELNQQFNPDNLPGTVPLAGSITLKKMATPTVAPGGLVTYTLILTNTTPAGSVQLHNITLTDTPPSSSIVSISAPSTPVITPLGAASVDCSKSTTHTLSCFVDNFAPGGIVTITFSATVNTTATGTITNTVTAQSSDVGTVTANASTVVTTPPPPTSKNLVILLQGINSQFPDTDPNLGKVGLTLKGLPSLSPSTTQFVNYSYAGSDNTTGAPLPYQCDATFTNTILQDILRLNDQIKRSAAHFGSTNIYLVGHSLGGVVAFGYMALLEEHSNGVSLPPGTKLKAVITLDSPLGGVPGAIYTAFSKIIATQPLGIPHYPCAGLNLFSKFRTFDDLVRIYDSPTTNGGTTPPGDSGKDPQGAIASIFAIAGVSNPLPHIPFLPSNDFVAGFARNDLGTAILSIGNVHDYLWEPNAFTCQAAVFAISPELAILASFIPDFRSTQFLEDQGNNSGHYGRSLDSNNPCIVASINTFNHLDVLSAADVQAGLTHFFAKLGQTPTPLKINPFQP